MNIAASLKTYVSARNLDNFFIIGTPLLALLTVAAVSEPRAVSGHFLYDPKTPEWFIITALLLTHSHIMLVFLRSHLNRDVFKRFPVRFTGIPLIMLAVMWSSSTIFGIMGFVALYWDEWHSIMQTFGFGRIYDAKLGNNPNVGRRLDMGMAFVVGLLPQALLLTYLPESVRTSGLQESLALHQDVAEKYGDFIQSFRSPLIAFGICYTIFYIWSYRKLIKNGYQFSKTKLCLFAATGFSSVMIASFYSLADGAYFGNIYHALQYYFIVYISEGQRLPERVGYKKERTLTSILIFFSIFLVLALLIAVARAKTESTFGLLGSFWLLSSLLHFWYDGFIWSVRKQDV